MWQQLLLFILLISPILASATPTILEVKPKTIIINNKKSKVFTIETPNGTWGYYAKSGDTFDVIVKNKLDEPTVIHWHGLLLPNEQDGTELTQKLIPPKGEYHYKFKLQQSGTYWMHSHHNLQEQKFAEAPLIIDDNKYKQQAVILFQDFSFKEPEIIMEELRSGKSKHDMSQMKNDHMAMNKNHNMKNANIPMDLNDVKYDAFLANYRPLNDPQIIYVKPSDPIRLRFINGAAGSNFWVNLGSLKGKLIAVDGEYIKPISGKKFQIAVGQRLDIIVTLPKNGDYEILGQVEGLKDQAGVILSTNKDQKVAKVNPLANLEAAPLNYTQELKLVSIKKLTNRKIDKVVELELDGDMQKYIWTINKEIWPNVTPITLHQGQRIELDIKNNSLMSHPIHLHGSIFKVKFLNGRKINGAIRDTILIMPKSRLKVVFDANISGKWLIHCHMLYHMHSGMMTYLNVMPEKS